MQGFLFAFDLRGEAREEQNRIGLPCRLNGVFAQAAAADAMG